MLRRTILLAFVAASAAALAEDGYRKPSQAILDVLHMLPEPQVSISPTRDYMLLAQGVNHPPIAEVARPMLRLAGLRIDPARNARRPTSTYFVSLTLKGIDNGTERKVNLPADARISMPEWSPDGSQFAFTNAAAATIELWAGNVRTGDVRRLAQGVNTTYGDALRWMPDSRTLLVLTAPSGRGKPPEDGGVPVGPNIQESVGKTAPVRTYQDLLSSPHDEKLFEYYVTSQLALIDAASGSSSVVGRPAIFATAVPSPDARYLLIARILR
ncbi:MAG: S9 family peptidase, partial [Bryobacteraceae bacterium]